uniref:F-box and leucine rich repeat protein 5 n=1 Tax=Pipistrellus kuhlii TaxID=59472 RepID=A0A7J8B0T2_PIPKU|nr:F-box and leucine rich repeat protein 5 [Pipistrellus kuhlii]
MLHLTVGLGLDAARVFGILICLDVKKSQMWL